MEGLLLQSRTPSHRTRRRASSATVPATGIAATCSSSRTDLCDRDGQNWRRGGSRSLSGCREATQRRRRPYTQPPADDTAARASFRTCLLEPGMPWECALTIPPSEHADTNSPLSSMLMARTRWPLCTVTCRAAADNEHQRLLVWHPVAMCGASSWVNCASHPP